LEILHNHHGAIRGSVTLLEEGTDQLHIEASHGLSSNAHRVRYRLGEGITGRVVESGKPGVVPKISSEPLFLNRAAQRLVSPGNEVTFICVPISINHRPIGTLSIDLFFKTDRDYDRSVKFFGVIASMIAQAIKMNRLVNAERQQLINENSHLREELQE